MHRIRGRPREGRGLPQKGRGRSAGDLFEDVPGSPGAASPCWRFRRYFKFGPVLKRDGKKGVKIKIFGPVFRGFSPEIDPGTPLDGPGAPPDINLHQKSAPEANSKAISLWARGGGGMFWDGAISHLYFFPGKGPRPGK